MTSRQKRPSIPKNWLCGAIFGRLAPTKSIVKKPGQWNHMTIVCNGKHISVTLNGETVTKMDMSKWTSATKNPDGSDVPAWINRSRWPSFRTKATSACKENTPACRRTSATSKSSRTDRLLKDTHSDCRARRYVPSVRASCGYQLPPSFPWTSRGSVRDGVTVHSPESIRHTPCAVACGFSRRRTAHGVCRIRGLPPSERLRGGLQRTCRRFRFERLMSCHRRVATPPLKQVSPPLL